MVKDISKVKELIFNKDVNFFLVATPKLKELIVSNEHPHIKKLHKDAKASLLAGDVIVLDKQDILDFVQNTLSPEGMFLFQTGDIRVIGAPSVKVS